MSFGNAIPREAALKRGHQFDAARKRRAKVARSAHGIGLEEVVGPNARPNESAKERFENACVVVHSREQHRLVHDGKASVGKTRACCNRLRR